MRELYKKRGVTDPELEELVDQVVSHDDILKSTLLIDDHLVDQDLHPLEAGLLNFGAFVTAGLAPLLPYVFSIEPMFRISAAITAVTLFVVGSLRSLVTNRHWLRSGLEMLLVGSFAALVAYGIGWYVQTLH